MEVDYIKQGDSLQLMKELPSETIDLIVTSPPYFNLRDYGVKGQIGIETDINDYIENLLAIFKEAYRVLKKSGSLWINIDDVYCQKEINGIKKLSLMCIPDRLKIKMVEQGWICRNEIIWRKPNAMPSSAKNRFNNDYEKFYFFVKSSDYMFNTQYEPFKSNVTIKKHSKNHSKYLSIEQESSVRQGMNKNRGNKIVALRKNLPKQEEFISFLKSRCDIGLISRNTNVKKSTIEHWFRKDKAGFSYPSVADWNEVKWLLDDYSEEFQKIDQQITDVSYETDEIMKNTSKGRLKRAVWDINTKASKSKHFASYPEKLVLTPILACTNKGDIVLDPFAGSGTTAIVSKLNERHYIGFELNSEYCDIARKRIETNDIEEVETENIEGQLSIFDFIG